MAFELNFLVSNFVTNSTLRNQNINFVKNKTAWLDRH